MKGELHLSATAREVFKAVQRAAVMGAALDGLLALEELREQTPQAGPAIDAGLREIEAQLCEYAGRGDGKSITHALTQLRGRAQAGAVLPKPYVPTPERPSAFPAPVAPKHPGGIGNPKNYPALDSTGSPRAAKQGQR